MHRTLLSAALVAMLAACAAERAPATSDPAATPGDSAATPAPVDDQPAQDVPPATAPEASAATPPTPDGDRGLARFDGYGDIRFGTAADAMAGAWGGELKSLGKEDNARCYFMTPTWVTIPAQFAFMIGDGTFVRFGTEDAKLVAPGGGRIGMTKADIAGLYPSLETQPHEYTDGEYLRVRDPAGGSGALVFETDGKSDGAKVTEWRVGTEPHVDFVEGCA